MSQPAPVTPPSPDWSRTALGSADGWPAGLRLAIDLLLNSPTAMLLRWGPGPVIVYNDAYLTLLGLDGLQAPGASVPSLLPPAWTWNNAALQPVQDGHSLSYRHQLLPGWRDGAPCQLPLDLYYTPVRDQHDAVAGILCTLVPAARNVPEAGTRPLRLLVVEDNPDARYLVCETLRALGHTVQAVDSAEAALPQLAAHRFDILFTDVSLPGMSGIELARSAHQRQPELALLFATGYGDALTRHLDFPTHTLQKPYDIEQLQQVLATLSAQLAAKISL
ncbi:MAG: response regulator [Sphingomonadaceae bacterium]